MASSSRRSRTNLGTTNLSTRRSRSTPRSRPFTADTAADERLRETATWKKTPVPSPSTWVSISKQPLSQGQAMEFESLQQARSQRLQTFVQQERELQLGKVKRKLAEIATARFGSLPAMFEAFGLGADDTLHLDQMTKLFTKHGLDKDIPRPAQRLLLDYVSHHKEHAPVRQLLEFVPTSDLGTKSSTNSKLQMIQADIVEKLVESRHAQKLPTDPLFVKRALLDELRLMDREKDGTVTEQQVLHVLGPERLDLGVPDDEVHELVQAVGVNDNGKLRYSDLVRRLEVEDKTSLYSPYFDLRTKVHTMHKSNLEMPWPFAKETEELLQLGLEKEQEAFVKEVNPSDELVRTRVLPFEQGVPFHLRPHTVHSHVPVRGNQQGEQALRRPTSSGEMFEQIDRAQTAHQRTRPIIRSPQPSLWEDDGSVDPIDHYRTMSDEYFSPLSYSPVTTFTRQKVSDADVGARKRENRRQVRYRRVDEYMRTAKERQHMDALATRMNDHQRVTNLSEHILRNAEIVSASDELREKRQPYGYPTKRFMPEQQATTVFGSPDGLARYIRQVKEDRDFSTVYSKDFRRHTLVPS